MPTHYGYSINQNGYSLNQIQRETLKELMINLSSNTFLLKAHSHVNSNKILKQQNSVISPEDWNQAIRLMAASGAIESQKQLIVAIFELDDRLKAVSQTNRFFDFVFKHLPVRLSLHNKKEEAQTALLSVLKRIAQ